MRLPPRITGIVAVALMTQFATAQVRDRVIPSTGTPINCEITAVTKTEVTAEVNGAPRRFPVNELRVVQFVDEPAELRKCRDSLRNSNFVAARSEVLKIAQNKQKRDLIQQDVEYYLAYTTVRVAMLGQADKGQAGGLLVQFVQKYPNSFHYFEAVETLGNLGMSMGKFDLASEYYGKMAEAPWPAHRMRAQVFEARSLLVGAKYTEALERYDAVIGSSLESIDAQQQKLLARVGRAACLAETGKPDQGLQEAMAIIAKEDSQRDRVLFARAYNAAGACYAKMSKPKDALMAYLHTDVLFNQDPDAHAEALYHLSKLWVTVKKSDRANRARGLLRERYAGSSWANRQ